MHINNNFMLPLSLLIMFDTLLLRPSLHCNTPLHFTTLYPTTLHYTSPTYTSLHLSLRFSQNCEVYNTVKPAYNGTSRDRNFFHDWQFLFNTRTWRLDLWDCKSFPLKTGFRSARVPFKRDFNLLTFVCSHFLTFVYVIYNRMYTWNCICVTWCWTLSPRVHSVKLWYSVSVSSAVLPHCHYHYHSLLKLG
jgi:hypothetical protein